MEVMEGIKEGASAEEYNMLADRTGYLCNRIQMSLDFLCKNSTNLTEVLVHLLSSNVISQHEREVVENQLSNYNRFKQLFTFLIPRLGHEDNSGRFVDAFQRSGNEHILDELKNAVVTRDSVPVPLATSCHNVQFNVQEPVPSFVGRTDFLCDLHQQILKSRLTTADDSTNSTIISRICVVTGLGGIGKSQTIRKYIHSYGKYYQHVVWIDAEENTTAENQFRRLALQKLDLSSKDKENNANDFDFIIDEIYDRLCTSHTLIVFDNAEALDEGDSQRTAIRRFLPKRLKPTHLEPVIIVTSRQIEWPNLQPTPLALFTPQESSTFIFGQLKLEESDANRKDARTLSETFEGLPLALQAAAAVILQECKRNKMRGTDVYTIQHLLSDYNQEKRKVLEKRPPGSPDTQPLMFLWKVSLDKIRQQPQGHLASHMLDVMAHLLSTNIPKDLLFFIFNHEDSDILVDAVTLLVDYSFVHNYDKQFSIHRILQDVTLTHLEARKDENPDEEELILSTSPLTRITKALREYWPTVPKTSEAYYAVQDNLVHVTMSHVLSKAQNLSEKDLNFIEFIEFVLKEFKDTRCVEAEKCCRELVTYFSNFPSHQESTLTSLISKKEHYYLIELAEIVNTMGRYNEAADICHEVLSSLTSVMDQEDVKFEMLFVQKSLAMILACQGEEETAIELLSSILYRSSNLYGPTDPLTLAIKFNLAVILQNRPGQLSRAKTLHAEILEVVMKDLRPLNPLILRSKISTGLILMKEGRHDDALKILREVAEVQEKELGPLHADTLKSNTNMAYVLYKLGKHEDALQIHENLISSYEASAASHLYCLDVKNDMAASLRDQGKLDEAKEILCRVLEAQDRLLGPNHISIFDTKRNLAGVLSKQGKYPEALKLFQEVLELGTKQLGPTHLRTLETNIKIAGLHVKMGNYEKSASIWKEVDPARRTKLPIDHPYIKLALNIIDSDYQIHGGLYSISPPLGTPQEKKSFIFRYLKLEESDANRKDVETLSETFGGLPLALQVAAAVILEEADWNALNGNDAYTIQHLLSDYNQLKLEILNKRPPGSPDAPPLMFLWKVALDKIRQQPHGHLATQILNVMAHLMSTNIPIELISAIFNYIDGQRLWNAIALLINYSFVHVSGTHFIIHHMLQDVTLAHLEASIKEDPKKGHLLLLTRPLKRITTSLMEYWPWSQELSAFDAVHDNLIHVMMSHVLPKLQNPSDTDLHLITFTEFVLEKMKDTRPVEAEQCCRLLINYFTCSAIPSSSGSLFRTPNFKSVQRLQRQLAWNLKYMGKYKEAVDICQELLSSFNSLEDQGDFTEEMLVTKHFLATILKRQGEYEEAIKLFHSVIDLYSKLLGPTHESTLSTKNNLVLALQESGRLGEARTLLAEILEVRMKDLGPHHPDTLKSQHSMALILRDEGRYDDALEMLREVVEGQERELGPLHADTLASNLNMALVLDKQGKEEAALQLYAHVISSYEKTSAASHPDCLTAKLNMAAVLLKQGRLDEAKEMQVNVLDAKERLLGPSHVDTLATRHNIVMNLIEHGCYDDALEMLRKLAEVQERELGPLHADTLNSNTNMAYVLEKLEKLEDALKIYQSLISRHEKVSTASDPNFLLVKNNMALILGKQGRFDEAKEMLINVLDAQERILGPTHVDTLATRHRIAMLLVEQGRYDDALEMLREVAEVREREIGPLHADTLNSNTYMAYVLEKLGKHEDALKIYQSLISRHEKVSTASDPNFLLVKNNMALILGKQGRFDEAKEMLRQVLDIQERQLGPNHANTLNTKDSMAELLVDQGKHTEALKLYEEVLELMTKQLGPVHLSTLQTRNSIGWLHLKMENFEKAESIAKEVLAASQATLPSNHPYLKDTEALYNKACLRNGS